MSECPYCRGAGRFIDFETLDSTSCQACGGTGKEKSVLPKCRVCGMPTPLLEQHRHPLGWILCHKCDMAQTKEHLSKKLTLPP
jgi:hypothetical protein